MLRLSKILHTCNLIGSAMLLACIILSTIGSMSFAGFGVDTSGKLYIGRKHQIEIYQDETLLEILPIPVRRGWSMAVTENDSILVANGTTVYSLSLDGNVTKKEENVEGAVVNEILFSREVNTADGSVYRLCSKSFWPTIKKNNDVVYRAPLVDVLIKVTLWLAVALFPPEIIYNQLKPLFG